MSTILNYKMPTSEHKALRQAALDADKSVSEFITETLKEAVDGALIINLKPDVDAIKATSANIDDGLREAAEHTAETLGISLNMLVRQAIKAKLQQQESQK